MTPDAAAQRARLWTLLGGLPVPPVQPLGELVGRELRTDYELERWRLHLAADGAAPALLACPRARRWRGMVVYHHAHGHRPDLGKDELTEGRPMLIAPPYADALSRLGFAALAIDHRGFGERASPSERVLVKRGLWEGVPLWGHRVADAIAASAWLIWRAGTADMPLVSMGWSMGSALAWWSAALDPRVDAVVEACGLAEFDALLAGDALDLHAEYFFVPGLLREFTAAAINALILPRPHLSIVGRDDPLTPPAGVAAIDVSMRDAASHAGAPGAWRQSVHATGHQETPAMRDEILAFLDTVAQSPPSTAERRTRRV